MRSSVALLIVLLGCAPAKGTPSSPASPSLSPPIVVGPPCKQPRLIVSPHIEVECWPERNCKASFSYTIDNCSDEVIAVSWVFARRAKTKGEEVITFDPPPTIPVHSKRSFTFPPDHRELDLRVDELLVAIRDPNDDSRLLEAPLHIVDAALEKSKSECLGRGDEWGEHGGKVRSLGCEAVMKDADEECHDERECQGYCFLEREEPVSTTEKRIFGRCTRLKLRFGCHTIVGKTNHGLMPIDAGFARTCVD